MLAASSDEPDQIHTIWSTAVNIAETAKLFHEFYIDISPSTGHTMAENEISHAGFLSRRIQNYLVYKVTGGGRIVAERSRFCPRGNYLQSELVFIVSLADV